MSDQNQSLNNLGGFTPIIDETGKITGYKTSIGGADTVFPFSQSLTVSKAASYYQSDTVYLGETDTYSVDNFSKMIISVTNSSPAFNYSIDVKGDGKSIATKAWNGSDMSSTTIDISAYKTVSIGKTSVQNRTPVTQMSVSFS